MFFLQIRDKNGFEQDVFQGICQRFQFRAEKTLALSEHLVREIFHCHCFAASTWPPPLKRLMQSTKIIAIFT